MALTLPFAGVLGGHLVARRPLARSPSIWETRRVVGSIAAGCADWPVAHTLALPAGMARVPVSSSPQLLNKPSFPSISSGLSIADWQPN